MKRRPSHFINLRSSANDPECDGVVVIGASLMNSVYGKDLLTPNAAATQRLSALLGRPMPVYGYATASSYFADGVQYYKDARAAFPKALIVMHSGGNNVSSTRPYSNLTQTQINNWQYTIQDLVMAAFGDKRFYPMSLSFRAYGNPSSDRSVFVNPDLGSKPFNEKILIPAFKNYWDHSVDRLTGRPLMDFYRFILSDYENMLVADGVHLTTNGQQKVREWMMSRVADIILGNVISGIPERVYDPTSAPVYPVDSDLTLSVFQFFSSANARPKAAQNGIDVTEPGGIAGKELRLINIEGTETPLQAKLSFTGNPVQFSTTAPGYGYNPNGRAFGGVYNNNLLNQSVTSGSLYITGNGVTASVEVNGCKAGSTYSIGIVASRVIADTRSSRFTVGGSSAVIVTDENPVVERTLTGVADGNGKLTITFAIETGTYGYWSGFSVKRQP